MTNTFSWGGLKIGILGFAIALVGAVTAFHIDHELGYLVALAGLSVGTIGVGLHFLEMLARRQRQE